MILKFIYTTLLFFSFIPLSFANQDISDILIFKTIAYGQVPGYSVNNESELIVSIYGTEMISLYFYKYGNKKLIRIFADREHKWHLFEDRSNNKHEYLINDKKYISLKNISGEIFRFFRLVINNNGNQIEVAQEYAAVDKYYAFYMDAINEKFYFQAIRESDRTDKWKESEEHQGLYSYDIKNNSVELLREKTGTNFIQPIRIPNTEYLLYSSESTDFVSKKSIEFWIQEIPEWKAEIEQQRKNEKLYPNAKKYFINGPANIRDNPKGKSIVYLNDWTEVLVLNQQGDWYEILYANIKGWTYKDNLRIGIKNE